MLLHLSFAVLAPAARAANLSQPTIWVAGDATNSTGKITLSGRPDSDSDPLLWSALPGMNVSGRSEEGGHSKGAAATGPQLWTQLATEKVLLTSAAPTSADERCCTKPRVRLAAARVLLCLPGAVVKPGAAQAYARTEQ